MQLTWVVQDWGPPGTRSTVACSPRDAAAGVVAVDGVQACGGGGGCVAARVDADGASSRPARRVRAGSRYAEATSRFRGSNCQGCDPLHHPPCRPGSPSSDCPTRNFRLLKRNPEHSRLVLQIPTYLVPGLLLKFASGYHWFLAN